MHSTLFEQQDRLDDPGLLGAARAVGLDLEMFEACRQAAGPRTVADDLKVSKELQIGGTPAFLLGVRLDDGRMKAERRLNGARPLEEFEKAIAEMLKTTLKQ